MPTGYTAGILDGKIKSFPDFAKKCMWAFCIHLKEVSVDEKYTPRKPHKYYIEKLRDAKKNMKNAKTFDDKKVIAIEKSELKKNIIYYKDRIKKNTKDGKNLQRILDKVINWTPPTDEHANFRTFMMEQLESTINRDTDNEWYIKELEKEKTKLKNLNANDIRQNKIKKFTEDIEYYQKHLDNDFKNCEATNKWVDDLLKSLNK